MDLNPTQGSLLGFLHDQPRTGWDLLQEVASGLARFWNVTQSHVYRELKVLEQRGLIEPGQPGPRDRRPFVITAAGRAAFAEWIALPPGEEQMRIPLLVTLWFGRHIERETLLAFLGQQRRLHQLRLGGYREVAEQWASGDPHMTAVVQFGIGYEEAVLRWLDDLELD